MALDRVAIHNLAVSCFQICASDSGILILTLDSQMSQLPCPDPADPPVDPDDKRTPKVTGSRSRSLG